jgi:thiosulfate reductase/polysulfide reductase chain A
VWQTATKKIQFTSPACATAGLSATVDWVAPSLTLAPGELRLIGGDQPGQSYVQASDIEDLAEITKDYQLTRAWLNTAVAKELGIKDGDEIEISNKQFTGKIRVKVTQRINPTALYLPSNFGSTVPELHHAYKVGLRQTDFVSYTIEPAYGGATLHETAVTVKKVGA